MGEAFHKGALYLSGSRCRKTQGMEYPGQGLALVGRPGQVRGGNASSALEQAVARGQKPVTRSREPGGGKGVNASASTSLLISCWSLHLAKATARQRDSGARGRVQTEDTPAGQTGPPRSGGFRDTDELRNIYLDFVPGSWHRAPKPS